ncbi:LPD1 domain-containing protein [Selenomonas ruminantium]|uniref:LPD1 domain-containing protein n=1 Tax=Selenomonas ruminantium TaxID=971 RepID=UPI0026F24103|nr:LPD1 domain-containing protein [Selenomonas ruminantium]
MIPSQEELMKQFALEYNAMLIKNEMASQNNITNINEVSADNNSNDAQAEDSPQDSEVEDNGEEEEETPEIPEDFSDPSIEDHTGEEEASAASNDDEFSLTVEDALSAGGVSGEDSAEEKEVNHRIMQDFGNKIYGARKDVYGLYQRSLETLESENVRGSLSKAWPQPNYDKLLKGGIEPWKVSAIRALRESIPSRSRQGYRSYWAEALSEKRKLAIDVLNDEFTADTLMVRLKANAEKNEKYSDDKFADQDCGFVTHWTHCLHQFMLYNTFGHDKSLNNYYLANNYNFINEKGFALLKKCSYEEALEYPSKLCYRGGENYGIIVDGKDSIEDLTPALKGELSIEQNTSSRGSSSRKEMDVSDFFTTLLQSAKTDDDKNNYAIYAYKKDFTVIIKDGFPSRKSAKEYISANLADCIESFKEKSKIPSERTSINEARVGEPYRTDNVTPEKFQETFGFYGVQFGNWVEGTKRQDFVNKTYDALLDLAKVLDVPAKALSLNGTLGLSFGGRGRGGKNAPLAHYEPVSTVVNLTKKNGAGSLAHEWFHALDNYLGRKENRSMVTDVYDGWSGYDWEKKFQDEKDSGKTNDTFALISSKSNLRDDLLRGILQNTATIRRDTKVYNRSASLDNARTKPYWATTVEVMARCFESYVKDKLDGFGIKNDFLVNIKDAPTWKQEGENFPYPYPIKEEKEIVNKAFDALVNNLKSKSLENGNVELFSCSAHDTLGSQLEACKPVSKHNLTQEQAALMRFSLEELGLPVAYFEGPETLHGKFSPDEGIMYLNRDSEMKLDWTFYHEAFHAMKFHEPELYQDLLTFVEKESIITKEQIADYREVHKSKDLPDDIVKEEMLANAFADKKTGNSIVYRMADKNPNLAVRFMRFTKNVAKKAISFFKKEENCKGELSASQFEAFSKRLDVLSENLAIRGKKPLSSICNIILQNGNALTPDDVKRISFSPCNPLRNNPNEQKKFDVHIATQLLKRYPQTLVQEVLQNQSPLRLQKGYVAGVMKDALHNRSISASHSR